MLKRFFFSRYHRTGLFFLVLLLSTFLLLFFYQTASPPTFILEHIYFHYDLDALEPRQEIDNQLCLLPRIHPFHPSIWGYLKPSKKIVCANRRAELTTIDDQGWLRFNESQVKASQYVVGKSLTCYWSKVQRGDDTGNIDDTVSYSEALPIPAEGVHLPPDVEILRVICRNFARFSIYDRVHARIRDVNITENSLPKISSPVNVLIFGIDSLSRLSFIRNLPLTYKYLTEELGMSVFRGMNKVGDNSFPNLVALLTGKAAYGGKLPDPKPTFDEWPLIWKNYSSAGYANVWAEDFPDYALFNYLAGGFQSPPTLHYLRPFWLAVKESPLLRFSSHMCYGATPRYMLQVKYLQEFISTYVAKKIPFFAFSFLAELSHEYMSRVASADENLREFFQWFAQSNQFENTLLVVMSDHGHRFDPIRNSLVGHIEERTPFFALRVPASVLKSQPKVLENIRDNSGRLVTPYDTHATLSDLLEFIVHGRNLGISPSPPNTLGRSLFGRIPGNRTCKDASIPGHFCVCESETTLDTADRKAQMAALVVVSYMNQLLKDVNDKCSILTLGSIKRAFLVKTMESSSFVSDAEKKVRIVVETKPGDGLFEAMVTVTEEGGEVWGDVSRISPYAGQSDCVRHAILRKYCFCAQSQEDYFDKL